MFWCPQSSDWFQGFLRHTNTATERESLCQLLQEKDQLQREQEDRIKNLTKLLVTSNVAVVPKVTDLTTVHLSAGEDHASDCCVHM